MSPEWVDLADLPTERDLAVCRSCLDSGSLPDGSACGDCPVAGDSWEAEDFAAWCRSLQDREAS